MSPPSFVDRAAGLDLRGSTWKATVKLIILRTACKNDTALLTFLYRHLWNLPKPLKLVNLYKGFRQTKANLQLNHKENTCYWSKNQSHFDGTKNKSENTTQKHNFCIYTSIQANAHFCAQTAQKTCSGKIITHKAWKYLREGFANKTRRYPNILGDLIPDFLTGCVRCLFSVVALFFFLNKIFSLYSITRRIQTAAHSTIPTKLLPTRRKPQSPRCPRVKQTLPQESSLQQVSESDPAHDFLGRESPGSHPPPPAQAAKQAAWEAAKCHFLPMHHLWVSLCRLQQLDWGGSDLFPPW